MVFILTAYLNFKSLRKHTKFIFGLGCAKYGSTHSESFYFKINPSRTKLSTYLLNIYPCNFGTGYYRKNIVLKLSFNLKYTRYILHVTSVTLNNSYII